jgi:hypothetical protein
MDEEEKVEGEEKTCVCGSGKDAKDCCEKEECKCEGGTCDCGGKKEE